MFRSIGDLAVSVMLGFAEDAAAVERATNEKRHGGAEGVTLHAVPVTPGEGGEHPAMGMRCGEAIVSATPPRASGEAELPARIDAPGARTGLTLCASSHAITPATGQAQKGAGPVTERDGAVTPRQVYREVVNTNGQPQARETYGKPMLTVLHGAQDQARSAATKRAPASATCLVLVTVNGVRVGHASALTGSRR